MKLTLAYRKRAVPMEAACYPHGQAAQDDDRTVEDLLREAALSVPAGTGDGADGRAWHGPDARRVHRIGLALRGGVQGSTRVRDETGGSWPPAVGAAAGAARYGQRTRSFKKAAGGRARAGGLGAGAATSRGEASDRHEATGDDGPMQAVWTGGLSGKGRARDSLEDRQVSDPCKKTRADDPCDGACGRDGVEAGDGGVTGGQRQRLRGQGGSPGERVPVGLAPS